MFNKEAILEFINQNPVIFSGMFNPLWMIAVVSMSFVYRQIKMQNGDYRTNIFVNAIHFINHDTSKGICRENLHSGFSIIKSLIRQERLKNIRKKEYLYTITITRFLIQHIRRIKTQKNWREFYENNLRDFYEVGYIIRIITKSLPKKGMFPVFYCFREFYLYYENIYTTHFLPHMKNGDDLFDELLNALDNGTKDLTHIKGFKDDDFQMSKEKKTIYKTK